MKNDDKDKKLQALTKEEIEVINQSIIDQLKAQSDPYSILIAGGGGGGGGGGSSK